MYYIGCHWGTEDDSYICSSNRMRDAYRRRSHDFKRRILKINISRENLLTEEHKWLSLIKDEELGKRYYNISKRHFGHWTNDPFKSMSIGEKISKAKKGKPNNSPTKFKKGKSHPNSIATQFKKDGTFVPWNKGLKTPDHVKLKQRLAKLGKRMSPATEFKKGQRPWNANSSVQRIR